MMSGVCRGCPDDRNCCMTECETHAGIGHDEDASVADDLVVEGCVVGGSSVVSYGGEWSVESYDVRDWFEVDSTAVSCEGGSSVESCDASN